MTTEVTSVSSVAGGDASTTGSDYVSHMQYMYIVGLVSSQSVVFSVTSSRACQVFTIHQSVSISLKSVLTTHLFHKFLPP